jgi:type IV pilus assembly protein PilE
MIYLNRQRGLHLIEVLIVLALIAISSQWALGHYEQISAHQHRITAQGALYELAMALEEYALENQTYAGATLQALGVKTRVASRQYILTIDKANDVRFVISARPQTPQDMRDQDCGVLSLSSEGDKLASGSRSSRSCWST